MAGLLTPLLLVTAAVITGTAAASTTDVGVRPPGGPAAVVDSPGPAAAVPLGPATPAGATSGVRPGWTWPAGSPPVVVHPFRVGPQRWSPGHRGVDLAAASGAAVVAAGAGRVSFVGMVAGRGVVAVDHSDGLRTTYEPVTASVRTGDLVGAGQVIGALGSTGSHCGAVVCLHWGLRRGTQYLDPMMLVRPPHPVLLPAP